MKKHLIDEVTIIFNVLRMKFVFILGFVIFNSCPVAIHKLFLRKENIKKMSRKYNIN